MIHKIFIFILLITLISCGSEKTYKVNLSVGDIPYDENMDDPSFEICHEDMILQYYNLQKSITYKGEKPALVKQIKEQYKQDKIPGATGYVTIRFLVNCKGIAGRYRTEEMDNQYNNKTFNSSITSGLLNAVKSLKNWEIGIIGGTHYDYYQYLTFKLVDSQIVKIMP